MCKITQKQATKIVAKSKRIVERVRIVTRPLTSTALCSSFGRSPETPAVSPRTRLRRLLGLVGEDVEGPGCRGASLANCKACVLLDQQSPRGARAEDFEGVSFLNIISFCCVPKGFPDCLLSPLCQNNVFCISTNTIILVMTQYSAPKQLNTFHF